MVVLNNYKIFIEWTYSLGSIYEIFEELDDDFLILSLSKCFHRRLHKVELLLKIVETDCGYKCIQSPLVLPLILFQFKALCSRDGDFCILQSTFSSKRMLKSY